MGHHRDSSPALVGPAQVGLAVLSQPPRTKIPSSPSTPNGPSPRFEPGTRRSSAGRAGCPQPAAVEAHDLRARNSLLNRPIPAPLAIQHPATERSESSAARRANDGHPPAIHKNSRPFALKARPPIRRPSRWQWFAVVGSGLQWLFQACGSAALWPPATTANHCKPSPSTANSPLISEHAQWAITEIRARHS